MMFRKNDLLIIGAVLLLGLGTLAAVRLAGSASPAKVEIRVNGETAAIYSLAQDREFTVAGYSDGEVHGVIKDGCVDVVSASCPDKICVDHHLISRTGESIVCLPNRVVITVIAGDKADNGDSLPDAVAGQ